MNYNYLTLSGSFNAFNDIVIVNKETQNKILKRAFIDEIELIQYFNKCSYNCRYILNFHDKINKIYKLFSDKYPFLSFEEIKIIDNLTKAHYKKLKRCKNYASYMFKNGQVYFLTLTFKNEYLNKTKEITRRNQITRILNKYFKYYCANVDYGKKNEREHYHALVFLKYHDKKIIDAFFNEYLLKFGGLNIKKVPKSDIDLNRTTKYLNKLVNHAFKKTCKGKNLIYSKTPLYYEIVKISEIIYL